MLDLHTIIQLEYNEMQKVNGGSDRPAFLGLESFLKQLEESMNTSSD
ncbi:hypothetical protein [Aquimarina pacifica]|nr:hypothetical protein [Aquimarina pacifica]